MARILVVDDEPSICWSFREFLQDDGHRVSIASSAEEALQIAGREPPDAVFLDIRLPGLSGLDAVPKLKRKIGAAPIIIMTAFGTLETAVTAVERGAFDYLPKPFDIDQAAAVLARALESRPSSTQPEKPVDRNPTLLVGSASPMQAVFRQLALVAASDTPVLITGETGTGKELAARAIHAHGPRRSKPFVPINVAALNPAIADPELFGHVAGAFGNAAAKTGLLELAAGGTVLLDEIGDAPLALQVKLLRALEQREIIPVGGVKPQAIDFRVIATTNRSLEELLHSGQFREDLFFRLSVVRIEMPALRERPEDIPLLARHFIHLMSEPQRSKSLTPSALCELGSRHWHGNVRELRNAVEHAAVMSRGDVIDTDMLPPPMRLLAASDLNAAHLQQELTQWTEEKLRQFDDSSADAMLYSDFLEAVEPTLLRTVLQHCSGNRAAASRLLGLHRATLRQKLRHYEIDLNDDDG